jgi:hypothetical protein
MRFRISDEKLDLIEATGPKCYFCCMILGGGPLPVDNDDDEDD